MTSQSAQQPNTTDIWEHFDVKFEVIQPKIPEKTDDASAIPITLLLNQKDGFPSKSEVLVVKPSTAMKDMHAYAKYLFRDVLCDAFTKFQFVSAHDQSPLHYGLRSEVGELGTQTLLVKLECARCDQKTKLSRQQLQLVVRGYYRERSNDAEEKDSQEKPDLADDAQFPPDLIQLCAVMCEERLSVDTWDTSRSDQKLKIEDRRICPINPQHKRSGPWHTARGTLTVRRGETCRWTLRVHGPEYSLYRQDSCAQLNSLVIGVASTDAPTGAQPTDGRFARAGPGHVAIADGASDAFSWACGQVQFGCGNRKGNGHHGYISKSLHNMDKESLGCGDTIYLKLDLSGENGPNGNGGELEIGALKKDSDCRMLWYKLYTQINVDKDYRLAASMRVEDGIEIVG